jgi:type IV secretory pathway TrbF-like protein
MNMNFGPMLKGLAWRKPAGDPRRAGERLDGGRRPGESENPYLAARRTWNDHVGGVVASRQMAVLGGVLCLLIALASVGGMTYIGSQSKFIPMVVEVDKLGQHAAAMPLERAQPADPRVVRASVAAWIADARLVTPDVALQRKAVLQVYAMLAPNDAATTKMNEWLNGTETSSPFRRAANETVSIEIETTLQQTGETWQVDWIETTRDRQGVLKSPPQRWRALVTVYTVETTPETTEEQMRDNPLGIHVRDFTWSKQL